jgi:2-polyprenyl-3-methyl-5-hydroxy-6-metoxy-1,4-benzoquinol methylase
MFLKTQYRTDKPEIMDDFDLEGEVLKEALDKIARINQLLGGNQLTLNGIKKILKKATLIDPLKIIDVGCGNGDMLRKVADFGIQNNLNFELIGLDANAYTISYAEDLSANYSNIKYRCENIFDKSLEDIRCDIVLITLTLHHFNNYEIEKILSFFYKNSNLGIVINDLQRSKIAYRLFQVLCVIFQLKKMSREDGLTSILRGFKKKELVQFSKKLNFKKYSIRWKWAFRYEWIIEK